MRNRGIVTCVALALGGIALPSMATAEDLKPLDAPRPLNELEPVVDALVDPAEPMTAPAPDTTDSSGAQEVRAASDPGAAERVASEDESAVEAGTPSDSVMQMTNWVTASGDNEGLPFMVIDKVAAEVFVHDGAGQLLAATPALFGVTAGDDSAPGVGDRELSEIPPEDRTTPAGRFMAKFGYAYGGRNVLWVDYATSISLHAVVTAKKKEQRLQRLESPTPEDNRITYGCINVPTAFYADVVEPLFVGAGGVVYILPETKPLNEVFLSFQAPDRPSPNAQALR